MEEIGLCFREEVRRSEVDFYGELEESVWVLKGFFEAAVWRKLIHVSEGILGLLFE